MPAPGTPPDLSIAGGRRSTLGTQSESKRSSAPSYGFGSGTRETQEKVFVSQEHSALAGGNSCSPGPAVYNYRAGVGPQVSDHKESAPQWVFGTDARFGALRKNDVPAPGSYGPGDVSIGVQPNSRRTTVPRYGFGTSTRQQGARH